MISIETRIQQQSDHGQDRISVKRFENSTTIVLADGAGGSIGGETAATRTIEYLSRKAYPQLAVLLVDEMLALDDEIMRSPSMGESTAICITVEGVNFTGAAVGDSEVYLYHAGALSNLAEHKEAKPLLGSVGCLPASFHGNISGGRVLLCSDGHLEIFKEP